MNNKPWQSKDYLYDRYVAKKMTLKQITEECIANGYKVTQMTIYNGLTKFNLIKNSRRMGQRSVGGNSKGKRGFYA